MKPPYHINQLIIKLISEISLKLGEINANFLNRPSPQLRKNNRIKTIHASLQIEGNTLSVEQITALVDKKRVIGPEKDIREVINAIQAYGQLDSFNPMSEKSFLQVHRIMTEGLLEEAGRYRKSGVGIVKGNQLAHLAPAAEQVRYLMKDLFDYLKLEDESILIKSCVFHYELEFIHPFADGNGRMGRIWQTLILKQEYPVFEFLPFETLISKNQQAYYAVLAKSDSEGHSTSFIEFMLQIINQSLAEILQPDNRKMTDSERMEYFLAQNKNEFTRKDYMNVFKKLSSATASRDIKKALETGLIKKSGQKNRTTYRALNSPPRQ